MDTKVEKQVADLIGENLDRQISEAASNMGNTVNALVEINVGLDRCGVSPGKPTLELVQKISKLKKIAFRGLMGYEGDVFIKDPEEKAKKCRDSNRLLVETMDDHCREYGLNFGQALTVMATVLSRPDKTPGLAHKIGNPKIKIIHI